MPRKRKNEASPSPSDEEHFSASQAEEEVEFVNLAEQRQAIREEKMKELEEEWKRIQKYVEERLEMQKKGLGLVVDMEFGKLKDFIPEDRLRDPKRGSKDAVQLYILTPDGYTIRKALIISLHPNSMFRKLYDMLGHVPKIGDKIPLELDSRGFWRVKRL